MGLEKPSPNRRLPLVDELFLYCCRVAIGMKEKVIADIFGISTTTEQSHHHMDQLPVPCLGVRANLDDKGTSASNNAIKVCPVLS